MSAMNWSTAAQNGKTSLNKHLRAIIGTASGGSGLSDDEKSVSQFVGVDVAWLPNQWQVTSYPSIRITYFKRATYDAARRCYKISLQIDAFTNERKDALCDRIIGKLLAKLGFDLENQILECGIPQHDWEGDQSELPEMSLDLTTGPELGPKADAEVIHLWSRFNLYFRQ